ncbi:MAG: beta strand repeat-containing protein, partial [Isosphaeraceae bacterium]
DTNQGDAAVNAAFSDYVLVQKVNSNSTLTYIASGFVPGNSSLGTGATSTTQSFPFTLPNGTPGTGDIRVTVTTNYYETIKEYDSNGNPAYSNNTASTDVASNLAKYADLIVAPGSLAVTPSSGLQSGGSATVSWSDENQGNGAVNGSYLDYVLVQRVNPDNSLTYIASELANGPSPLAAAATGTQESFPFTLPDGASGVGNFKVTVTTDYYESIPEYDSNGNPAYSNNSSTAPFTSTLANYADLVVTSGSLAVTPSSPQSGGSATATWTDTNQGDAAVNAAFSDYVLVQKVNSNNTLTYIASGFVPGNSSLGAGATSGTQSFPFTLPNGTPGTGDIRVTVTTDYYETIKEYDSNGNPAYGNNTASTDVTATLAPSPDLVVQNIVVNPGGSSTVNPDQTIPVTWNDYNQGSVAAYGTWTDQVFLASDAAGTQNLQLVGTVNVSDNLAPSGALAHSTTITIPATDVGNKYVVVETGLSESFFEFDTANDTSVSSSFITIPPSVQVSLAAPGNSTFNKDAVNPASSATVTRNDTNVGSLLVFITSSNPSAVLLTANPGDTPAASISVVIPNGSYSAVFYVDAVQDNIVDGTQTSSLSPSASGYLSIPATATETETNTPTLTMTLESNTFADNGWTTATLTRNTNSISPLDTAVTVGIASSDPSVATAPATVTIPAGQNSVTFPITGVATSLLVDTRSVTFTTNTPVDPVTGRNFAAGATSATVTDTNTPVLELVTDAPYVEENASNPATYATLSLTDGHGNPFPLASAINVSLSSNDPSDLTVPGIVSVPAGTTSVRIPLTAIDNPNNDNPVVTLTAYALDAITSRPIATGHATTTLSVLDTNGPSLSIAAPSFISVASGISAGSVSLNTTGTITYPVTIDLSSSNPSEATVPSLVTLLGNRGPTVSFNITVPAGAVAGPVTISASLAGYNMAARTITIVTVALPDLTVSSITPPSNPQAGDFNVPVSWVVTNDGNIPATGSWSDRVVLSSDPGGQNVISSQLVPYSGGSLAVGQSYTGSTTFNVPSQVGTYYLTVTTNTGASAISEITTSNDSLVAGLDVGASYYASLQVQANEKQVPVGSPVTVTGIVTDTDGVTHPVGAIVFIAVYQNGKSIEELGPIFANPNGTFAYTFEPSANNPGDNYLNAGDYQFFALTNGQTPAQVPTESSATATVLGMSITPSPVSMDLVPGTPYSGTMTITNLSSVPLTNLVVTNVNEGSGTQTLPISVSYVINYSTQLPGTTTTPGQLTASYTLTATEPLAVSGRIYVTIDDDQDVPVTVQLDPTITPPTPRLTSTSLNAGVVVDTDTLASFTLTNSGSASSGPITVVSPVDWITLASLPAPLAPGQSEQVEMQLTPAETQTLGEFTGTLGVDYGSTGLSVPFTIDVVSNQQGSVQVVVNDQTTTLTETGGHLAGALVQLINPLTSLPVASGTTTSAGVTLTDVTAGTYELVVSAPQHSTYTSPYTVQPGVNTTQVYINENTVTYTWTVVPTTIPDNYTIQLQADFVTQVPIPNLVPATPFEMPLLDEGGSVEFTENVTNEGLIEATNVKISAVSNGTFTLTPLVTDIPVLPAQSEYPIPVELTANPGATVESYDQSSDCCNLPELNIEYSYVATNPVEQVRQVKVYPVFVTDSHYAAIENAWGANTPSFSTLTQDLFNSPNQAFIQQVLTDTPNSATVDPQGNPIGSDLPTVEGELLSALANGLTGTVSDIATNFSSLLSDMCDLTEASITGSTGGGGGGGYGGVYGYGGGGGGGGGPSYTPVYWNIPTTPTVTAQVRVEINQNVDFTRDAFEGTLALDNDATTGLSNIQVNVDIKTIPAAGGTAQEATNLFYIEQPQLTGFTTNADGSYDLAGTGTNNGLDPEGTATYTIIPTEEAAPTTATQYAVGGTLTYTEADGTVIDVPLLPAQITVEPSPDLVLNYFWQQQVEGQDALTPAVVQPSVPFPLGVEVTNIGYGPADNFSITSAQPKIIENAQGLLVGFNILGSTVDGKAAAPSLTADFGNIEPGATGTAAFIMESTLAGYFDNFTATYQHDNALGGAATSLIDSVDIHNLVQMVEAGYVGNPATLPGTNLPNPVPDDGIQDFLVSDLPGSLGQPDTLYLSNGTTDPVAPASDVSVAQVSGHEYQITAEMPAGWGYFDIADPTGGNLDVGEVARPDGLDLIVANPNDPGSAGNVWNTVQNITSDGFVTAVNDLHLLDYNANAVTITYDVFYTSPNSVTPQIVLLQAVKPSTVNNPVSALDVTFNEPINLNTFTAGNLSLTLNGGAIAISGVTLALVSGTTDTYQISGLAPLTAADGNYQLTVSAVGVEDSLGDVGTGSVSTSWTMDTTDTNVTVQDVTPPPGDTAFNSPVTNITVVFSEPVEQPTFTTSDLSLTLNGGANLINSGSGVQINDIIGGKYNVILPASLTTPIGNYDFSIDAAGAGILDVNGNPVVGSDFTDWTMDTTAPVITSLQEPQSPRNIVVPTLTVTFSKPINPATFTLSSLSLTRTVGAITTGNLLDSRVTITPDTDPLALPNTYLIGGINFPQAIAGTYTFTIGDQSIMDFAGNLLGSSDSVSWVLDLTVPAAPSALAISPDLGPNPNDNDLSELTNSQTVTFSGTVDANTVEVRLQDLTTSTYLGDAFLTGQDFSRTLSLSPGLHELSAQAFDLAGNGSPVSDYDVFVDVVGPTINSMAPIVPNPATTPVDTEDVVLNELVKTFDWTALSLTLNGTNVRLNSSVMVTLVPGDVVPTYQITGLTPFTTATGNYVLTVNASQISDYAGLMGSGNASVAWSETQTVADATITNTVDDANPHEGSVIQFTVTVTNAGPANATIVSVLDALPSGLTLEQAASGSGGSYDTSTGVWSIAQINANSSITLTLTASVNIGTSGDTLKTLASITAIDQTDNATPIAAEQDVTVQQTTALTITNLASAAIVVENGALTYNLTVKDSGPATATDVVVSDTLPAGLTPPAAPISGVVFTGNTFTWTIASITAGGQATVAIPVTVNPGTIDQTITDTATITQLDQYDSNVNTSASASVSVRMTVDQVSIAGSNSRTTPVGTVASPLTVTFSDPIAIGTLTSAALTLTDNGTNVPIPASPALVVTQTGTDTYQITGLGNVTAPVGNYVLTVNAGAIEDAGGYAGTGTATASWTTLPSASAATGLVISPNTGISAGITDTGAVTFTGNLSAPGMTVDVFDTTTNQDLGDAIVTGTTFSLALNLAEGSHVLRARAMLNGTMADAYFTVLVDLTKPTSHVVNALGTSQTSDTVPVSVTFSDPAGPAGAPASGVESVSLYDSVNNGPFTLYQTLTLSTPSTSGTVTFSFAGKDRNLYAFHSIAEDAAGNVESKSSIAIEASTSVPDLNPPVTHILTSSPTYSWGPFPSSEFSGLAVSSYTNGVFTLNWAGADPDQNTGTPAGSIALVNIYVEIDGGTPALVGQVGGGTPNGSGVYSGSMTYDALGDGLPHSYGF